MLRDSDRFIKAVNMISDNQYRTILDIGCRDKILKKTIREIHYMLITSSR